MDAGHSGNGWHARLLAKAAQILGGEQALRTFLRSPASQFQGWMEGKSKLPPELFLKVVDLLSQHDEAVMRAKSRHVAATLARTAGNLEASRATLARTRHVRGWSVLMRAARVQSRSQPALLAVKHRLFDTTFAPRDRAELLETALDATLNVAHTDLGNVQVIDAEGALRIAAHRGVDGQFLKFFDVVSQPGSDLAMSRGRQVFIADVQSDAMFRGTDAAKTMATAGCIAITSTPVIHETGLVMGMISTQYRKPCDEHDAQLASLELVAARTASWLDVKGATV